VTETYNQEAYTEGYPPGIERHFWHVARADLLYRTLKPRLGEDDLVLDLGCGTGIAVQALRTRGLNVRGVELGPAPVLPGMEAYVQTSTDVFELDAATRSQVKAVLMLDVLEHMQYRRQFLHRLAQELPHCHTLLLTVPARMELWSNFDTYWGHHLRYNRPGLRSELEGSEFTPRKTAYFFHWVYLVSFLQGLLPIKRNPHFGAIAPSGPGALLHRFLGFFTRGESRLVPGWLVGSSLLCLAYRDQAP
jgi:SAM-dependent methyltransferase